MYGTQPRTGTLVLLPNKAEVQASFQTIDAWVSLVPVKSANLVCKLVDGALQILQIHNLQHFRRFIKPDQLPASLERIPVSANTTIAESTRVWTPCALGCCLNHTAVDHASSLTELSDCRYFLVCATPDLAYDNVLAIFSKAGLCSGIGWVLHIWSIKVPLLPPTSEQEAAHWTHIFWPTIYKKHNCFGPHPALVSRAYEELRQHVGGYMGLAASVAHETSVAGFGECVGAVVAGSDQSTEPLVIAVAGDARWHTTGRIATQGYGNIMAHAVMRAIGMVASKRNVLPLTKDLQQSHFTDRPLTEIESTVSANAFVAPDGYLCVNLDLYITHEPCVMCSMAILHSRFRRVVFAKRLIATGGLSAELGQDAATQGGGYGIFSRPSLNWKFLTWQWLDEEGSPQIDSNETNMHA